jgi:hypothetical protein
MVRQRRYAFPPGPPGDHDLTAGAVRVTAYPDVTASSLHDWTILQEWPLIKLLPHAFQIWRRLSTSAHKTLVSTADAILRSEVGNSHTHSRTDCEPHSGGCGLCFLLLASLLTRSGDFYSREASLSSQTFSDSFLPLMMSSQTASHKTFSTYSKLRHLVKLLF